MKVLIANPPWSHGGCRAGSRWPHSDEGYYKESTILSNIIERLGRLDVGQKSGVYRQFPHFMAYATAVLEEAGVETRCIDSLALEQTLSEFMEQVVEFNPDICVFETSTPSFSNDMSIIREVRNRTGCKTVVCGVHVTALPEGTLQHKDVDFILMGEYELSLRNLVRTLQKGGALSNVKGLAYKEDGKIRINESQPLANLDELPFPAWHQLPMEKYWDPSPKTRTTAEILTSRGCPYGCTYCTFPQLIYRNKMVRYRNPKKVVDEIELLMREYGKEGTYFDDDTFTLNKRHVIGICDEIRKRGLRFNWACFGRVDNVDMEMLKAMKDAGCVMIKYGVESGSQRVLDKVDKGYTIEQVKKAFKLTKEVGIQAHATFMVGLPGETRETIDETLKLAREIDADSSVWALLTPFPGTRIYNEANARGHIMVKEWEKYDGHNYAIMRTDAMTVEEIEGAYENVKRRWKLATRRKPRVILAFMKTSYRNGGLKNLFRIGMIKFLEVCQDLFVVGVKEGDIRIKRANEN